MGKHSIRAVSATVAATAALASLTGTAVAAPAVHVDRVALTIKSDTQHAKKDANGKWHDAYLPAAFSARTGDKVVVTIRNYDLARSRPRNSASTWSSSQARPRTPRSRRSRSPRPGPATTPGSVLRTATRGQ